MRSQHRHLCWIHSAFTHVSLLLDIDMPTTREIPLRGEQVDYTKNESEAIVPRHPRHVHCRRRATAQARHGRRNAPSSTPVLINPQFANCGSQFVTSNSQPPAHQAGIPLLDSKQGRRSQTQIILLLHSFNCIRKTLHVQRHFAYSTYEQDQYNAFENPADRDRTPRTPVVCSN